MTIPVLSEESRSFFRRSAKAWQNYFDTSGLLPGIITFDGTAGSDPARRRSAIDQWISRKRQKHYFNVQAFESDGAGEGEAADFIYYL